MTQAFIIKDCALLAIATGQRAYNLSELADRMANVPIDCLYYHFWGGLLRPVFDDPDFRNDFAVWANRSLNDPVIAERLGIIDPTLFEDFDHLREALVEVIEDRIAESETVHTMIALEPFHFMNFQIVIFDTGIRINQPEELRLIAPKLSLGSFFYHFIDSRRRLHEEHDDFSEWMTSLGGKYRDCISALRSLDPYLNNLSELRELVSAILNQHLEKPEEP